MAGGKAIMGVMFGVLIAVVLLNPIAGVISDTTGTQTVTNETVTAQTGEYVDLNGYEIDENSETVYYDNGTDYVTATEGTDYEIAYQNGSIKALSGGNIGDGDQLKVSYEYQATSGSSTTVITLVPLLMGVLIIGVMAQKLQEMM